MSNLSMITVPQSPQPVTAGDMPLAQTLSLQDAAVRDGQIKQLSECRILSEDEVQELCSKCKELLSQVCALA